MPIRPSVRAVATLATAAALAGAAVTVAAPAASAASTRPSLTFVAGPNRVGVSSRSVHPGLIHVRNAGHPLVAVLIPRHPISRSTVARDLSQSGAEQALHDFLIADIVHPGNAVFFTVPRGRIFLVNADRFRYTAANVTAVRVTGARIDDPAPRSFPVTITSRHEVLTPQGQTVPTESYLRVSNRSPRIHDLALLHVRPGVSTAAARHFVRHPSVLGLGKVVDFTEPPHVLGGLSRHRSMLVHYHVSAGRYLLWDLSNGGPAARNPFGHRFALLIAKK
jgi:hypothetical protein